MDTRTTSRSLPTLGFVVAAVSLLVLAACRGGQATESPPATATTTAASATETPMASAGNSEAPASSSSVTPLLEASAIEASTSEPSASEPSADSQLTPAAPSAPDEAAGVRCKSHDDCWVVEQGAKLRIIPRPAHLRGRKFRPCEDGEAAPVCRDGYCTLAHYGC